MVLPQGARTTVRALETADGPLQRAEVGQSISLKLADHLDVSRGDLIAAAEAAPEVTEEFEATVCWFGERPLRAGDRLKLKHTTRVTPVVVEAITGTFDVNELPRERGHRAARRTRSAWSGCTRRRRWPSTPMWRTASPAASSSSTSSASPPSRQAWSGRPGSMTDPPAGPPSYYPVSLDLSQRPCLVVGAGPVAARKARGLLACGARVSVIAPDIGEEMRVLTASLADLAQRPYRPGDAAGFRLVITATGDPAVDGAVAAEADAAGVWVNSADDPTNCSFILPAVHRDGAVTVAVSTGGLSPALASWLRNQAAASVGSGLDTLARLLSEARQRLRDEGRSSESVDWAALLDGDLPALVRAGDDDNAKAILRRVTAD